MPAYTEFVVRLDDTLPEEAWTLVHLACETPLVVSPDALHLSNLTGLAANHRCPPPPEPVDPKKALDYGIFAISTMVEPDASGEDDVKRLEKDAVAAIAALTNLRDFVIAAGEDLPSYVIGEDEVEKADRVRADSAAVRVLMDHVKARRVVDQRPLSDFALHIGLLPEVDPLDYASRAAGLWLDPNNIAFGRDHEDRPIEDMPGLFIAGTWTEWGEGSETDPTTHLVYNMDRSPWDLKTTLAGVLAYIKAHKGWGRLSETVVITEAKEWSEAVATVHLTKDGQPGVVIPRNWRDR